MAPTSLAAPVHLNSPSERHHNHLRRLALGLPTHPPAALNAEQFKPRTPDLELQPSVVPEGPSLSSFTPTPSESVSQGSRQPGIVPGNLAVAVVLTVLVLSGLIGLFVGGEMLRREAKATVKKASPPRSVGRRKSKSTKNATGSSHHEKSPYNERKVSPIARPPPALHKERQRRLTDVWPIRSLSRIIYGHRACPETAHSYSRQDSALVNPQTTWSEFTQASLYVAPPRTVLARIPEEREEDCQSQTSDDILGVTHRRPIVFDSAASTPETQRPELSHDTHPVSSVAPERHDTQDCQTTYVAETSDDDTKSLGSSAPGMTSDGGESSRSSIVSLESLEGGESLREGVFELRRAQAKSMQMNKGVLLSLSLKTPPDDGGPPRPLSTTSAAEDKDHHELSLAMLGGSFSAVNLDEFPSPPSTLLPVIPSLVSGF